MGSPVLSSLTNNLKSGPSGSVSDSSRNILWCFLCFFSARKDSVAVRCVVGCIVSSVAPVAGDAHLCSGVVGSVLECPVSSVVAAGRSVISVLVWW